MSISMKHLAAKHSLLFIVRSTKSINLAIRNILLPFKKEYLMMVEKRLSKMKTMSLSMFFTLQKMALVKIQIQLDISFLFFQNILVTTKSKKFCKLFSNLTSLLNYTF